MGWTTVDRAESSVSSQRGSPGGRKKKGTPPSAHRCQQCGCTNTNACFHAKLGPCHWVNAAQDLCSHCASGLRIGPNVPPISAEMGAAQ